MKFVNPLVIAVVLCLSGVDVSAAEQTVSERLLQKWAATWKTSNVDQMMQFYDEGNDTVAIESLGHVRQGSKEIRNMYEGAFDELRFDRVTLTFIAQGHQGTVAWATCRYRAEIRLKATQAKFVLQSRGTFILRKDGETWKIATEHFSTIPRVPRVQPAN